MEEILKGMIYDSKYNEMTKELDTIKIYHIYKNGNTIHIDAPFPVKYIPKLRMLLLHYDIYWSNIIIGKPDI